MAPEMASSRVDVRFAVASDTTEEHLRDLREGLGTTGPSGRQVRAAETSVGKAIEDRRRIAAVLYELALHVLSAIRCSGADPDLYTAQDPKHRIFL